MSILRVFYKVKSKAKFKELNCDKQIGFINNKVISKLQNKK